MKKLICLLLVSFCILTFAGCISQTAKDVTTADGSTENSVTTNDVPENSISDKEIDAYFNTFDNFKETFTKIKVEEKNYIIKTSDEFAGEFYEIYDNNGNFLDEGYHSWRGSFDITKEDDIIVLEHGFGGTNVHPAYRIYNVKKGVASRYYVGPIAYNDSLVAYFNYDEDDVKLIVQDIFDIEKYYVEFSGKFDKFIYINIQEISFNENGTKIVIKHRETNNESNIIEETFVLD